tara:strand:- start:260 stop:796 length:537 start_codon:yes stop_codon:yes gene_type:complete
MKYDFFLIKKFFCLKDIGNIYNVLSKYSNSAYTYKSGNVKTSVKYKITDYGYVKNELKRLMDKVHETNNAHFGYDLYDTLDCQGFHLHEYLPNDSVGYDWHTDANSDHAKDIKLTVLLNLSDKKYKGGEIKIFGCDEINFNEPGDILIFKSFMPHKVDRVIKGTRKTLTFWMQGPCFK